MKNLLSIASSLFIGLGICFGLFAMTGCSGSDAPNGPSSLVVTSHESLPQINQDVSIEETTLVDIEEVEVIDMDYNTILPSTEFMFRF